MAKDSRGKLYLFALQRINKCRLPELLQENSARLGQDKYENDRISIIVSGKLRGKRDITHRKGSRKDDHQSLVITMKVIGVIIWECQW